MSEFMVTIILLRRDDCVQTCCPSFAYVIDLHNGSHSYSRLSFLRSWLVFIFIRKIVRSVYLCHLSAEILEIYTFI